MDIATMCKLAADKIEVPNAWTKGAEARTSDGDMCDPDDPEASCWCMFGALRAVSYSDTDLRSAMSFLKDSVVDSLKDSVVDSSIAAFNDRQSDPRPVIDVLRRGAVMAAQVGL